MSFIASSLPQFHIVLSFLFTYLNFTEKNLDKVYDHSSYGEVTLHLPLSRTRKHALTACLESQFCDLKSQSKVITGISLKCETWNLHLKSSLASTLLEYQDRCGGCDANFGCDMSRVQDGSEARTAVWCALCQTKERTDIWFLKKERKGLSCWDGCSPKSSWRNADAQTIGKTLNSEIATEASWQDFFFFFFCFALCFYFHLLQIFYLKDFVRKLIKRLLWKESATLPPSLCLMAQDLSHKFILIKLRFSRCSLSCNPYVIVPNIFSTIDVTLNRLLLPAILLMALALRLCFFFFLLKIFLAQRRQEFDMTNSILRVCLELSSSSL